MSDGKLVIVLEDRPQSGFSPLRDLDTLIKNREYGDRNAKPGRSPQPTAIVRAAIRAYSDNIDLIQQARKIGLAGNGTTPASDIIRTALTQAIRFKQFAAKKAQETAKRKD